MKIGLRPKVQIDQNS